MKLTRNIIIGLVLGILVGIILNAFLPDLFDPIDTYLFDPVGKIFLNLIKMLVVPIVFFSIVVGTMGISDPKKLGRMGAKTITFFLVTTTVAISIAMALAFIVKPGVEGAISNTGGQEFKAEEAPPVIDTLLNIIPTNPVASLVEGNMLQIIAFAIFIGLALAMLGDRTKGLANLFEQANDVMMYLVRIVMLTAPFGAFALIASAVGGQGKEALASLAMYFVVVLAALLIHALVTYSTAVAFLGKVNPLTFFKKFSPAMAVAFSTSSSSGTLPVSMKTAQERLGISKQVSSFVQPLGATINMDGTAIMQGVATVFIAQITGTDLSFTQIITVVVTATVASVGTAGVPGVGLIMLAMVLKQVGLPLEPIGLILAVDRLLDMTRTAVNITGDAACALFVNRSEADRAAAQE
ncbi:dicarboxylate/amino acid:cation symporter [Pseudalkalibacillus caeni]|uniref:Dicarboxylate/amino acid:cation symporter n=1 Tax=Exobacillus caeni TaxID=2574798 RepID=A0A5R9F2G5_9BACL|nr:dicarboxylate/amino acid:cation symporter [Pseudalkalibacillus caeni]TLS36670.1 dicarboxylate/amino acid:cation symporter [Pseudalkalibacillus caeni]